MRTGPETTVATTAASRTEYLVAKTKTASADDDDDGFVAFRSCVHARTQEQSQRRAPLATPAPIDRQGKRIEKRAHRRKEKERKESLVAMSGMRRRSVPQKEKIPKTLKNKHSRKESDNDNDDDNKNSSSSLV
jgi:hypothetical protein